MSLPFNLAEKDEVDNFSQSLFYFLKEFGVNPLDEEYLVYNSKGEIVFKIVKKGITLPLFNKLLEEMQEHYKKESEAMKKASRRR
jgi:hypothetical protein